jgi:hypothetical protein
MRLLVLGFVVAIFVCSIPGAPAQAAAAFESEWVGESAFLTAMPGQTYEFTVFFANTGSSVWIRGTTSQVNLGVCLEDKVTCNVPSPNAAWSVGWLSAIAYTTHVQDAVLPGEVATFKYRIRPPTDVEHQRNYVFNGDLVVGATLMPIHPQGYLQIATAG